MPCINKEYIIKGIFCACGGDVEFRPIDSEFATVTCIECGHNMTETELTIQKSANILDATTIKV